MVLSPITNQKDCTCDACKAQAEKALLEGSDFDLRMRMCLASLPLPLLEDEPTCSSDWEKKLSFFYPDRK